MYLCVIIIPPAILCMMVVGVNLMGIFYCVCIGRSTMGCR